MKIKTKEMIMASIFAALTIIGAKLNLLLPDIPVTMQPIIVMMAGCLLGGKTAFLSQAIYIIAGIIGIPVFSKPIAGPAYLLQPSFGYLIGFLLAAYVIGRIVEKSSKRSVFIFITANMIGLIIIYLAGTIYMYGLMNLYLNKSVSIIKAFTIGVLPFIVKDFILGIIVSILSYSIYIRLRSVYKSA